MMFRKAATLFSTLVIVLLLSVSAGAANFTVGSLNTLHLGWGKDPTTTNNKCTQIKTLMSTVDVLLLQEVMDTKLPCTNLGSGIASECSASMLGATSYKEAYCLVFKTSKMTYANCYYNAPTASFSRPPLALLMKVSVGSSSKYVWFANIHSIFGKTVGPRQAEAAAAGVFFKELLTVTCSPITVPTNGFPVIIGGDWNLAVTNNTGYVTGFTWADPTADPATKATACPTAVATSLTPAGVPSSPYDHIVITGVTLKGDTSCPRYSNALSFANWRKQVSDHLAIYWGITFK